MLPISLDILDRFLLSRSQKMVENLYGFVFPILTIYFRLLSGNGCR